MSCQNKHTSGRAVQGTVTFLITFGDVFFLCIIIFNSDYRHMLNLCIAITYLGISEIGSNQKFLFDKSSDISDNIW